MSLETGPYFISSVSFATGVPVSRPLGLGPEGGVNAQIVVLPLGSPPPVWEIIKISSNIYKIYLEGRNARVLNDSLLLSFSRLPPFEWRILRGAPSPPPIGTNSFGITVPDKEPQESWFIPSTEGNQGVPVPVTIGEIASSILIVSAKN